MPARKKSPAAAALSRRAKARQRRKLLDQVDVLLAQGCSKSRAAKAVGKSYATIFNKWSKRFEREGFNGLLPRTDRCGREPKLKLLGITPEIVELVQRSLVQVGGNERAWKLFIRGPACPVKLRDALGTCKTIPPSLLAATRLKRVPAVILIGKTFRLLRLPGSAAAFELPATQAA
jgi:hypothetical protein